VATAAQSCGRVVRWCLAHGERGGPVLPVFVRVNVRRYVTDLSFSSCCVVESVASMATLCFCTVGPGVTCRLLPLVWRQCTR